MRMEFHMTPPDDGEWKRLINAGTKIVHRATELTATEFWRHLRMEAPTDTGRLAGSFNLARRSDTEYAIQSGVTYALFVHTGTAPHTPPFAPIAEWARRKGLDPGRVWHGIRTRGTQPNPYADRAWDNTLPRISEFVRRAVREAGEEF